MCATALAAASSSNATCCSVRTSARDSPSSNAEHSRSPERARVAPREPTEDHERLEVVAVGARVVVVVGPKIQLAGVDAVVGVRVRDAGLHRSVPRVADGDHRCARAGGCRVVCRADVGGHCRDRRTGPRAFGRVHLDRRAPRSPSDRARRADCARAARPRAPWPSRRASRGCAAGPRRACCSRVRRRCPSGAAR